MVDMDNRIRMRWFMLLRVRTFERSYQNLVLSYITLRRFHHK